MCTVSWSRHSGGVDLFFNRDEQRSRMDALPPRRDDRGCTAPIDPQGGGTWIFVNRHALCGVLLNTYAEGFDPPAPPRSRGLLLLSLGSADAIGVFEKQLRKELDAHSTVPCLIGCVTLDGEAFWHWDGQKLCSNATDLPMLTTSGYRPEEIVAERMRYFRGQVEDPQHPRSGELELFHGWRDPARPAYSTVMARGDARTVSRTVVKLRADGSRMTYEALPYSPRNDRR
ncbi:MAG: NRDE family protein [Kiritimatiellia bacterium]